MGRGVGSFRPLRSAMRYRYCLGVLGCSMGTVSRAVVVTAIMGLRDYFFGISNHSSISFTVEYIPLDLRDCSVLSQHCVCCCVQERFAEDPGSGRGGYMETFMTVRLWGVRERGMRAGVAVRSWSPDAHHTGQAAMCNGNALSN